MKKGLLLLTVMISNSILAQPTTLNQTTQQPTPPMLKLGVYDLSGKVPKDVGLKYSIKNKNLQLCWAAFNMPFSPTNQNEVIQQFVSPKKTAYNGLNNANIVVSPDGKTTTIKLILPSHQNQFIEQCWKYEKSDPLGKYKLTVRVNDIQFDTLEFELVK